MMHIIHYREKCIGCGTCIEHAPFRWELSKEDGKANLKKGMKKQGCVVAKVSDDEYDAMKRCVEDCPMRIIKIESIRNA